jgi:aminoglycoside 3-N-acetyltransferase
MQNPQENPAQAPMANRAILTHVELVEQFHALGMQPGHSVIVHSALGKIGDWIAGGIETVVIALTQALGDDGTLMMPTHTPDNSDPANWSQPPVPVSWWQRIRDLTPPFDPRTTPCPNVGRLPDYFRAYPGTLRSTHPLVSFAARGRHAADLTRDHGLEDFLGEESPIGRLNQLDGYVLLLGVGHDRNTSLHLAEYRAEFASKHYATEYSAVIGEDGRRAWRQYRILDVSADDFTQIGADYEQAIGYTPGRVGQATARYLRQRPMVDFATAWMAKHRT